MATQLVKDAGHPPRIQVEYNLFDFLVFFKANLMDIFDEFVL